MFSPPRKLHPYCRSERDTANKRTAHHRAICSAQAAPRIIKSLFAPNHGPLLSATFTYFSCILPSASVAGDVSRQQMGSLVHHTRIVQSISYDASSTEIPSPAAAFWAATDAAASASQLAFNAVTSWRTSASPGIKCEMSLIKQLHILDFFRHEGGAQLVNDCRKSRQVPFCFTTCGVDPQVQSD